MELLMITFGQAHVHRVYGKTFDCDCVAVIAAPSIVEADAFAFRIFDGKFHQHVSMKDWDTTSMHYFPNGYRSVNF